MAKKIAVVPGDGIGPEVIAQGMRVLERINERRKLGLQIGHFEGTAEEIAVQEDVSTRKGVDRIIRYAFEFARRTGRKSVCMSDKSNVMRFGGDLWMRTFEEVAKEYPDLEHSHMFVDALAMQMV